MIDKLKVVWICHISNKEIQEILKPSKKIIEMAPWIFSLIKVLENQENIELHIISQHEYISGYRKFCLRGIYYHFFNAGIPVWGRHWPGILKLDYWLDFAYNKFKVKKIVEKIKPDIIHLQGAENAYYSSTIFQFKDKYPLLITLQGFLHKVADENSSYQIKKKVDCELSIYQNFNHFGVRTIDMGEVVKEFNPNAILHWHGYGINISMPKISIKNKKKYDLVFFAMITKIKGIEDFLKIVEIIKNRNGSVSALIIGLATPNYLKYLKDMVIELDIKENVTWTGFLPEQSDVHKAALQAKVCVLPVQYDMIPGTIVESMFLKIPVVTYNVGSIPEVNIKEDVISIVEKGNIESMAEAILKLLDDKNLYIRRAEKAYNRIIEMSAIDNVFPDLMKAYRDVITDFNDLHS